jgi:hypothetical protein
MTVEGPEISGKVFRFLSAMHPALSKSERKRYAGYDPDKWYPWTPEVSAEFTDLMRRSPRDSSFARGFAYVAQRAIPEGGYVPTRTLLECLDRLPAAFRSPEGSGFEGRIERAGHASVSYGGMPGFSNVCIAIQGELAQRIQASGAHNVVVRHGQTCRVNGGPRCEFEVEWTGETPPANAYAIDLKDLPVESEESPAPQGAPTAAKEASAAAPATAESVIAPHDQSEARNAAPAVPLTTDLTGEDLFLQLRKRLSEADRQAHLYQDARNEIDRLKVEISRVKAQADSEVASAYKERDDALEMVADLKRKIRGLVADE